MRLNSEALNRVTYIVGSADLAAGIGEVRARAPFDEKVTDFLNDVSQELMRDKEVRAYPDAVTFAFWIRQGSVAKLRERFDRPGRIRLGKGAVFHIAPSNVPVNFAYSLAAGLLTGNANIVRIPSKDFPQVRLIISALNRALTRHESMRPYVICVKYDHDKTVNDLFSSVADVRVVWGGDSTIAQLRESPLPPRSGEIAFADRWSLAVINADSYLEIENKIRVAEEFYNDTFLSDQNACTSPRIIVWTGERKQEAKEIFWAETHKVAAKKYTFQPIQGVDKLAQTCLAAAALHNVKQEPHDDNLIVRISVPEITEALMNYRGNSGYFYEYDCDDIMKLVPVCDDKHCQTIAYIGDNSAIMPLIAAGPKGIDRVVPMGKTMDFDLLWDGYDLTEHLTRTVVIS